jgi:putative FmdB family regulatory protein
LDVEGTGTLPLYPYRCTQCGHKFEKIQHFNSAPEKICPQCGGVLERTLTAPGLSFKGAGWYVNDYASKSSAGSGTGSNAAASESASDAKSDNKSDTKSETKSDAKSTGSGDSGATSAPSSAPAAPAAKPGTTAK